jgi:putative addiction module antidote
MSTVLASSFGMHQYYVCYNNAEEAIVTTTLKLTQIGNSVGVILPKELLARLKVQKGDTLFVTDTPGGVGLTPFDPTLDEQLALGREFMREYRDTFRQLAK